MPPKTKNRIALLSRDRSLHDRMGLHLQSMGFQVVSLPDPTRVRGFVYADPPDVIIIDFSIPDPANRQVLRSLKQDSNSNVIPVIGLVGEPSMEDVSGDELPLDDFVSHPVNYRELSTRIRLSLQRIQRIFDNNPITKLPGNRSIAQAVEQALGKPLAVCYADISNFKPYNDAYGFSRGDEVLRMVGLIMSNTVRESKDGGFVGHIGGDDFVFIVPLSSVEAVCKTIIDRFTMIASDLFVPEDRARGYYVTVDRKGDIQKVPLLGISIGVVPADNPLMKHPGKVAEVASDLKKLARKSKQSCYVVDRRRTRPIEECVIDLGPVFHDE